MLAFNIVPVNLRKICKLEMKLMVLTNGGRGGYHKKSFGIPGYTCFLQQSISTYVASDASAFP